VIWSKIFLFGVVVRIRVNIVHVFFFDYCMVFVAAAVEGFVVDVGLGGHSG